MSPEARRRLLILAFAGVAFGSPVRAAGLRGVRRCDTVVLGATVVTVDAGDRVYSPDGLAIEGGKILSVGRKECSGRSERTERPTIPDSASIRHSAAVWRSKIERSLR